MSPRDPDEPIPRQWRFCKSFPKGQLLETEGDYERAHKHSEETGEEWHDSPAKVADEIAEEASAANAMAEEEAANKGGKSAKKTA